jgi:hypothetical protein
MVPNTQVTCFAPEEQHVYSVWLRDKLALRRSAMYKHTSHVAHDGANSYLVARGYKHAAPPEQRQVSQRCGIGFFKAKAAGFRA